MKALGGLLGVWRGSGQGNFPTIDAFTYDEEIVFTSNEVEPLICYEQKTWDTTNRSDHTEPLHWEVGFIRSTEDGPIEISNAQNNGRVEVLRGQLSPPAKRSASLLLLLDSVLHGHDERMIRTRRRYQIGSSTLSYEVEMATRNTPDMTLHLQASLEKLEQARGSYSG